MFGRVQEPILEMFWTNTFNICIHESKQVFQNSIFPFRKNASHTQTGMMTLSHI